jgi:hypothetical protein
MRLYHRHHNAFLRRCTELVVEKLMDEFLIVVSVPKAAEFYWPGQGKDTSLLPRRH